MARISVITIAYTVFIAFFYILTKGWQTTISRLNRNQATNLTMIMGGIYLCYSAYFLSTDFEAIYVAMNIILLIVYLALAISFCRSSRNNMKLIAAHRTEEGVDNIMQPSLRIKYTMLKYMGVAGIGYALCKAVHYGVINMLGDQFFQMRAYVALDSLSVIWFTLLLVVCRPRKQWPEFFTLSFDEMALNGRRNEAGNA